MKLHKIAILLLVYMMSSQVGQAYAADDWVDDDQVNGFYKKGIIRTRDDYETPPQDMQPGDIEDGYRQQEPDDGGSQNQSFSAPSLPRGNFSNQIPPNGNPQFAQPPPNKSFFGKAKSLGKSIVTFPNKALMGDDGFFDNPGLWQGAGAVAGMGANTYLNYKMNRNNPYYGGGYGLPYGGAYNPYGGIGMPYSPYSSVSPYGFGGGIGNPYYGSPYGSNPLLPFGLPGQAPNFNSVNPAVPYSPYGLGNYGLGNLGGYGNPGFGGGLYGRPGIFGNGLGGFGNRFGGYGNGLGGYGNGFGGYGNGLGGFGNGLGGFGNGLGGYGNGFGGFGNGLGGFGTFGGFPGIKAR